MERSVITSNGNIFQMATHLLLKEAEKGSNFVFSPLSFILMLSLVAVGSRGSTLDQMLSFLEVKNISELTSLASRKIFSSLISPGNENGSPAHDGPILSFANGAWIDQSFSFKPSFKEIVECVYHATAQQVDFANKANQVTRELNSWVENHTKGLISSLLPPDSLDSSDTVLVLANALYFKGAWDRKFDASRTEHRNFHLLNGQVVQVPFMTQMPYQRQLYRSFDGYKVLRIPYQSDQKSREFFMYFFLPDARAGLYDLIPIFELQEFCKREFDLQEEDLREFWIPRFKFSFKFEASNTMKESGLDLPFSGGLTEMVESGTPHYSLVLSKVFHESCIEANEDGTEAATSTAPKLRKCCAVWPPPTFVADHPFMFMIKEEKSKMVVFIGAVLNPLSQAQPRISHACNLLQAHSSDQSRTEKRETKKRRTMEELAAEDL